MDGPALSGAELREQVAAAAPEEGRAAVWWLGQSGYLLRWGEATVAIDPFLTSGVLPAEWGPRQFPPPLAPAELTGLDLVLLTNSAPDHLDPLTLPAILAASPEALLVLPVPAADYVAEELGLPDNRLVPIGDGELFAVKGLQVRAYAAARERLEVGPDGACPALSYILRDDLLSVLFGGDTVPFPGQAERLTEQSPQVACLPINGRDADRRQAGLAGNLTIAEAARLADAVGAEVIVPNHYGLLAGDSADPAALAAHVAEHYPRLRCVTLEVGVRWDCPGNGNGQ